MKSVTGLWGHLGPSLLGTGLVVLFGCSSPVGRGSASGADEGAVGEAQFAVKSVPNDVQCIQVTAVGSRTLSSSFDVQPNQSAQLSMPGLPAGAVTFTANAFSVPCTQVTALSVAGWSSAPVTVQVVAASIVQVNLVMVQTGTANIGIDFATAGSGGTGGGGGGAGSGGASGLGSGIWDSSSWDQALWQ